MDLVIFRVSLSTQLNYQVVLLLSLTKYLVGILEQGVLHTGAKTATPPPSVFASQETLYYTHQIFVDEAFFLMRND